MSQPYNPRVVVEKTSNALLQRFFSHYQTFSDVNWKTLAENDAEVILQRVRKLDEANRRLIGVRFRQVHALADSRGTTVLIAAAGTTGPDIAVHLQAMRNAYERAFWCLVEHPKLFDSEPVCVQARISGDKRGGIEQLEIAAARGRYLRPFAKILLAMAALREKKTELARIHLMELAAESPENALFVWELSKLDASEGDPGTSVSP